MAKAGQLIGGKYKIIKEIGTGGMSTVYLAVDERLKKEWAVKEIDKTKKDPGAAALAAQSLLCEAALMKRLDHSAFPRIVDISDNGRSLYVVMDYIEGSSLDRVLSENGPQSEEKVTEWARQLCAAIGYLHSLDPPVIYRDIKPGNIMVKSDGTVKIIDFGTAREYDPQRPSDNLGTKGYAPPEQYEGKTDERSDIYSLGMTLCHLLTGADPRGCAASSGLRQYGPEVSEGMRMIIDRCTRKDPDERYQSCRELSEDLEDPERVAGIYKKQLKKRMRLFCVFVAALIVFSAAALSFFLTASCLEKNSYERLVSEIDSPESYIKAIELKPFKTDAYIRLLEYYEETGSFTKEEAAFIQSIYNKNSYGFDKKDEGYAQINYRLGLLFFSSYSDENGLLSLAERIRKAAPYFEANHLNTSVSEEFEDASLSECYFRLCSFYTEYIYKTTGAEAKKEEYEELLAAAGELLLSLEEIEEATEYDILCGCSAVFFLIYDQCTAMANASVAETKPLELMDNAFALAEGTFVQKETSAALKEEIVSDYRSCRQAVQAAFSNAAKNKEEE